MSDIKILHYKAGSTIIVKGSRNDGYFYIVKQGLIDIRSGLVFDEKELSRFEPGDTFGLVSALTDHKHLATLVARADTQLVRVSVSILGSFLKHNRKICVKMLNFYAQELRALDHHLSTVNNRTEWDLTPSKLALDARAYANLDRPDLARFAAERFMEWHAESPQSDNLVSTATQVLQQVSSVELPLVSEVENRLRFVDGQIIFVENQPSSQFFVITKGRVKLTKLIFDRFFGIGFLNSGEVFGEMSLLNKKPRLATAEAVGDTELIRLNENNFLDLVGEKLLQSIFENLAHRIWFTYQRIPILRISDPKTRLYFALYAMVRERMMKQKDSFNPNEQISFLMSSDDLKKMCGLLKISNDRISDFLEDPNLDISESRLVVKKVKDLEIRLFQQKLRSKAS